jgi:hypothetical protein
MTRVCTITCLFAGVVFCGSVFAQQGWVWENPLPQGNGLNAVVYGSDKFVAVGYFGALVTSLDGISWTRQTPPTTLTLNSITFSGST